MWKVCTWIYSESDDVADNKNKMSLAKKVALPQKKQGVLKSFRKFPNIPNRYIYIDVYTTESNSTAGAVWCSGIVRPR